ncbi:hypothetical protein MNBD_NITROSPINAE04-1967, partial [hydrothermal vent metagenome]
DIERIQKFTSDGKFLSAWGESGKGPGEFVVAAGIGIDKKQGALYLADFYNKRVSKFTLEGKFLSQIGTSGRAFSGALHYPTDAYVDDKGNVYVADSYNYRIQKFSSSGEFVNKWGGPFGLGIRGKWRGWFYVPSGVTVDEQGHIIVADSANNRVVILSSDGKYLAEWNSEGSGGLYSPTRVAVGNGGVIYVADTAQDRIVVLKYKKDATR